MHRLTALALMFLMACGGPRPASVAGFRSEGTAIYSSAVLENSRLDGHWVQVATFAANGGVACAPGTVDISNGKVTWTLCLADGVHRGAAAMVPGKAGRFAIAEMADWWVLWVDGDYRTLAIGTPSGQFGFVLNRDARLPPDRLVAVRDIFRFNGYRSAELSVF